MTKETLFFWVLSRPDREVGQLKCSHLTRVNSWGVGKDLRQVVLHSTQ